MHSGVVHKNTAFLAIISSIVAQAQRIGHIPAHAREHHFQRVVDPFGHLAQGANNRTLAEIKHELDCRLRLLRQNRNVRIAAMERRQVRQGT